MRFLPKIILFCFLFFVCRSLSAQTNVFTYQGFLNLNGAPASGTNFNLSFAVYDASTNGNLLGACQATNVVINYGLFNVPVDVGPIFNGNQVWLEISVLSNSGPATVLSPRQPLTFTPRALYARTANNLIGSVSAAQISGTIGVGQLPGNVITNGETGIVVSGNFIGNGSGLTNIPGLLYQKKSQYLYALGDSIIYGANASNPSNCLAGLLSKANNLTLQNLAVGGGSIGDYWMQCQPGNVYSNTFLGINSSSPSMVNSNQVWLVGMGNYNGMRDFGTNSSYLLYTRRAYESLGVYLSTPQKVFSSNSLQTGSWSYWPYYGGGLQTTNSTNSLTFTNIVGNVVYVAFMGSKSNDLSGVSIKVNGINYGVFNQVTCYGNRVNNGGGLSDPQPVYPWMSPTNLWMTPLVARVLLPGTTANTVTVTPNGSGPGINTTVLWVCGNGQAKNPANSPIVLFTDTLRQSMYTGSGSDSAAGLFSGIINDVVLELESDGLPVYLAPCAQNWNAYTMLSNDGVHPSDFGFTVLNGICQSTLNQANTGQFPNTPTAADNLNGVAIGIAPPPIGNVRLSNGDSIQWQSLSGLFPGVAISNGVTSGNVDALYFYLPNSSGSTIRQIIFSGQYPFMSWLLGTIGAGGIMQPITFGMSATAGEYIFDQISTTNITSGTAGFTLHDNIITNISSGTGNQYIYRVIVNGKTNFTVDANGKITGNGAGLTNLSGMIQTFATNITIVSATNTTISFAPGFADTNYVVNIPPVFVGGYINFKSTNSFTLSFPSLSLSGIPAEGTVVHR